MSALSAQGPLVERLEETADIVQSPCGDGQMVWHVWGDGPPIMLLHGGYGSWTHWAKNIDALSADRRVIAADLPGLGDSAAAPPPHYADDLVDILEAGLSPLGLAEAQFDIAGFSFGAMLGGVLAARLGDRVAHFAMVGAAGLGAEPRTGPGLKRAPITASQEDYTALQRRNLGILMLSDGAEIDDATLAIHVANNTRARVRSRPLSRSTILLAALPAIRARLIGIWGEHDITATPDLASREAVIRQCRPDVDFHVVAGAGHWVQYEAAERFNPLLLEALAGG